MSSASSRPLRFGIMGNGTRFPAWQAEAIRTLIDSGVAQPELLIVDASTGKTGPLAKIRRLFQGGTLLWNVFNKLYVERRSRASRSVDLTPDLEQVPLLNCRPIAAGKFGQGLTPDDIATIRSHDLDFVLRFGFGILKGDVLESARWGVWSFHHGDERSYRGRPPGFWEMQQKANVMGSILQRLTERLDSGVVLHRGHFGIVRHSYVRTRDGAFFGSADWPTRVCRELLVSGSSLVTNAPQRSEAPVYKNPGNLTAARFLASLAIRFTLGQWRSVTRGAQWSVGVIDQPIATLLDAQPTDARWLPEPGEARYFADPFPLPDGDILVEEYDHSTRIGWISVLAADGTARRAIDLAVHASYPFVISRPEAVYCIPETYQAGEVALFRWEKSEGTWVRAATLLEGVAALDATVFEFGDRWWLFCTDQQRGANTKLFAWHAPDLWGPWEPHALNPLKTDVRSSRPAGTPFCSGDAFYRPAQDSSDSYGGAVVINRIDALSPTEFAETAVTRIGPIPGSRYPDGLHTISAAGETTIIDGRRDRFIASAFRAEVRARLRRR